MRKLYKPCLKDDVCQISVYWDYQILRRRSSKIHQILPLFLPRIGPNRCQPLNVCKIESPVPKDASYQIWVKSVQLFWRRSRLKEKFMDGWMNDGLVSLTWFLPYIPLWNYEKILKVFALWSNQKILPFWVGVICYPKASFETNLNVAVQNMHAICQLSVHSVQWFMRKHFLKVFAI